MLNNCQYAVVILVEICLYLKHVFTKKLALCFSFIVVFFSIGNSQVVINEVNVKPGTSSTSSQFQSMKDCANLSYGSEYIELYNTNPCASIDISCYIIATPFSGLSSSSQGSFRFPIGTIIPPLGFLSLGGANSGATILLPNFCSGANAAYLATGASRWYLDNFEEYIALYDASGNPVNVVYWTSGAAEQSKWNNSAYDGLFLAPSPIANPSGCNNIGSLAGPSAFLPAIVSYAGAVPAMGTVIERVQDGSVIWATNAAPTLNACNGTCIISNSFLISAAVIQPGCGLSNGSISITPSPGPISNYTFTWSPNISSGNSASSLASGSYDITIVSNTGCQKDTTIILSSGNAPSAVNVTTVAPSCGSLNGSVTLGTVTGGVTPYQYNFNGQGLSLNTIYNNLGAGTYTLVVQDNNGCTYNAPNIVLLDNNTLPTITLGNPLTLTCTITSGVISVSTTTTGAIYNWSGSGIVSGGTTSSPTVNSAGSYLVTVTNPSTGCSNTSSITVSNNTTLPNITTGPSLALNCILPSSTISASSSTSGVTYSWTGPGIVSGGTTSSPTVNVAGSYLVTVTNPTNGCTNTSSVAVTQSVTQPNLTTGIAPILTCTNLIGVITVSSTTGGVTYNWSGPGIVSGGSSSSPTVNASGSYTVIVTDPSNSCTNTAIVSVINNNTQPNVTPGSSLLLTCSVITGTIGVSSSTVGVTYNWSGPGIVSGLTTNAPVVNVAGNYMVTVTNPTNGCTNTSNISVTSNIAQPTAIPGSPIALTCTTTSGSVTVNSSTAGVTYNWSGPGIVSGVTTNSATVNVAGLYSVTITNPVNACTNTAAVNVTSDILIPAVTTVSPVNLLCSNSNGNISVTTSTLTALYNWSGPGIISGITSSSPTVNAAGIYNVTVTNTLNGCTNTASVNVLIPSPLIANISANNISCHGQNTGNISLSVSGGAVPYSFHWSNNVTSQNLSSVTVGIYQVTITDINGCTIQMATTLSEPQELYVSCNFVSTICYGTSTLLSASVTGGTPSYNYFWNGLASSSSLTVTPLSDAIYNIVVADQNGCTASTIVTVNVAPPISIALIQNIDSVCSGDPVILTPVVTGGVGPPYTFFNQNGGIVTSPIIVYPNQTGSYSVSVLDACGTSAIGFVSIFVYPLPPAAAQADVIAGCQPLTVNFSELYPEDGRTFVWDFGDNENLSLAHNTVHTYTSSGTYTVTLTVTSQYGCKNIIQYTNLITVFPKPNAQYSWYPEFASVIKPIVTFNNLTENGQTYIWTFGDGDSSSINNPTHLFPDAGLWQVELIAISNNGCTDTVSYPVEIQDEFTFYAPTAFSPDLDKNNDFFFITAHGIKNTDFYLSIYDRWGEVIWATNKYDNETKTSESWDGRAKHNEIVPIGTYTWFARFKDENGNTREKYGPLTVIR